MQTFLGRSAAARLIAAALAGVLPGGGMARAVGVELAQTEPQLPEAPPPLGPLRRGPDGRIEIIDPTREQGNGAQLCDSGTICVGKDQAYGSLADAIAAARDGDTIEIVAGSYHETAAIRVGNVTVRGISGRPQIDCGGLRLAEDKACLVLDAPNITIENLEITGAEISPSLGANGACIRNGPDASFTVRGVICHGSQNGILSDGGTILVENSEFYDNGWTGSTHNVYFSGKCVSVTVRGSTFRDARIGHEFKSRCRKTEISDSTFRSTHGSRNLDIPDGGATLLYRSTLVKTPGAESDEIVGFTPESCNTPGDLVLKEVHIVNSRNHAVIHNFDKCQGHPIILEGVTYEGTPVVEQGYVLKR
jgi:hypothetical protein